MASQANRGGRRVLDIADEYGVNPDALYKIARGYTYRYWPESLVNRGSSSGTTAGTARDVHSATVGSTEAGPRD